MHLGHPSRRDRLRRGWWVLDQFPRPRVADEGMEAGEGRVHEPMETVPKPLLQEIELEKRDRRPQGDVGPSDPETPQQRLLRLESRLGVELLDAVVNGQAGEVVNRAPNDRARSPDDRGVQGRLIIPDEAPLEETPLQVRERPAPAEPPPEEVVPSRDLIGHDTRPTGPSNAGENLVSDLRGHPLVSIENQDPIPGRPFDAKISLSGEAGPGI